MTETTLATIDELLETACDDADDPDIRYKLRSARQLVQVLQQRPESLIETLDDQELMGTSHNSE